MDHLSQVFIDEHNRRSQQLAVELLLPRVANNEFLAVRKLIEIIIESLVDGTPLDPELATYLGRALKGIAGGESAPNAFGYKRKKGERSTNRDKAFMRAYNVEVLRQRGITVEEAIERLVSSEGCTTESTVKKAWKAHHTEAKKLVSLHIDAFGWCPVNVIRWSPQMPISVP